MDELDGRFVRLGDLNLSDNVKDGAHPEDIPVKRTIRHPSYKAKTSENDIGLVQLSNKVKFTGEFQKVPLSTSRAIQLYSGTA